MKWAIIWQMRLWLLDVVSSSFPAFTDELHGKGREVHIEEGLHNRRRQWRGRLRARRRRGSDEPRLLNIVYIRSSKSVRRRFLFLGSTRERVSAVPYIPCITLSAAIEEYERKGWRSDRLAARSMFSALIAQQQQYPSKIFVSLGEHDRDIAILI